MSAILSAGDRITMTVSSAAKVKALEWAPRLIAAEPMTTWNPGQCSCGASGWTVDKGAPGSSDILTATCKCGERRTLRLVAPAVSTTEPFSIRVEYAMAEAPARPAAPARVLVPAGLQCTRCAAVAGEAHSDDCSSHGVSASELARRYGWGYRPFPSLPVKPQEDFAVEAIAAGWRDSMGEAVAAVYGPVTPECLDDDDLMLAANTHKQPAYREAAARELRRRVAEDRKHIAGLSDAEVLDWAERATEWHDHRPGRPDNIGRTAARAEMLARMRAAKAPLILRDDFHHCVGFFTPRSQVTLLLT